MYPFCEQTQSLSSESFTLSRRQDEYGSWETSAKQAWLPPWLWREDPHSVCQPCLYVFTAELDVFDIYFRQICLGLLVFWDEESTEVRCKAKMWEGSRYGSLWLIFPLVAWQGEDKALIMNCDTLMSLSSTDNTWSDLLAFNLWYQ